jgi:hypothetical protein
MHITAFTTPQLCHVAQAVYEYWQSSRAMLRTHTIQMTSQLRAGQIVDFHNYVKELVRSFLV